MACKGTLNIQNRFNLNSMYNSDYKYILDKSSKKFHCPECDKKRFVRYIDTETGDYLPEKYGKCDREISCTYHLNPYKDGFSNGTETQVTFNSFKKRKIHKPSFIPYQILEGTYKGYDKNTFLQNLLSNIPYPFNLNDIENVISMYHLGTVTKGYRKGAVTFPFIDKNNNIRAIQVKQFDKNNHTTGTDFLHSIFEKYYTKMNKPIPEWLCGYNKNETKVSCLFGEHLLSRYPNNPIALVEAPKTAIYGALYFNLPKNTEDLIWLAVYNKSSLTFDKIKILQGRVVYLFPDLDAYDDWNNKAIIFENKILNIRIITSDLLELHANDIERKKGLDLADYLIKLNWREFRN